MTRLALAWRPLEPPRRPVAVLAEGAAAHALAATTAGRLRSGVQLRAAVRDDVLVVTGIADDLPWAEGAVYLGEEDGLLLPTLQSPGLPADLLLRAIEQQIGPGPAGRRVAVVPGRILAFAPTETAADPEWLGGWASEDVRS